MNGGQSSIRWRWPLYAGLLLLSRAALAAPTWTLVWSDEFNGPANSLPDPTRWTYDLGGGGWGNGELETYTSSTANVYQDGAGHLVIQALDNAGNYSSARLKSEGLFNQAYGRIEASLQLPAGGSGVWPAFWMLGDTLGSVGWPTCGEIDLMENGLPWSNTTIGGHIHGPVTGSTCGSGSIDYNCGGGVGSSYTLPSGSVNGGFHTYAVEWNPTQIVFYVDSVAYQTLNAASLPAGGQWIFNHPFFILLNLAVGGASGSPAGTAFPQQMLVDYVRVYKLTANGTTAYGGSPAAVPGTVQAEDYDAYTDATDPSEPGEGFAYNDLDLANNGGLYRVGEAVDIEACSDSGGGYDVGWTHPGEWLQYSVNVAQSATYTLTARVACNGVGGSFHFDVDGSPATAELTAPNTGGWQTWQDVSAGGVTLTAGPHQILLVEDSQGPAGLGNFNYFSLALPPTPTDTPSASPNPTASPSATASPTVCACTASATASASTTSSPTPSASPGGTVTDTPSPTGTPSVAPGAGTLHILGQVPVPSPWSGRGPCDLDLLLDGPADAWTVRLYSAALVRVATVHGGPGGPGWVRLPLAGAVASLPAGLYFYVVTAQRGGTQSAGHSVGRLIILR